MDKKKVNPERTDSFFMKETLKMAFEARLVVILMTVVLLGAGVLIYSLTSRPAQIVVIDGNTGRTYAPINQANNVAQNLIDRQLVYYTGQVIENYFCYDHSFIERAHQAVWELSNARFRDQLGEDYLRNADVLKSIADRAQSFIQWDIHPRITNRNDPYYTVFGTMQRVVKVEGLTQEVKKFNVRVDFGRLENNLDYTKRPHSLVLLDIKILNEGSVELNEQINRMQ